MSKASEIIVLAEDRGHQNFARGFLKRWGYRRKRVRFVPLPAGGSSGEQYVREHYAVELEALRKEFGKTSKALIVPIDADRRTTAETRSSLNTQLRRHGVAAATPDEPVCLFIPKRHIGTWVVGLRGITVHEDADYKQQVAEDEIQPAGRDFGDHVCRNHIPEVWPRSLQEAVPEAHRVPRD